MVSVASNVPSMVTCDVPFCKNTPALPLFDCGDTIVPPRPMVKPESAFNDSIPNRRWS